MSPAKLQKSGSGSRLVHAPLFLQPTPLCQAPPMSPALSVASSSGYNNRFGGGGARSRTQSPSLHGPVGMPNHAGHEHQVRAAVHAQENGVRGKE